MDNELKKIIDGKLYWHYTLLRKWDKNEKYREITDKGWLKLLKSLQRSGVKDEFEIDEDGIVYDGNNRLEGTNTLISQDIKEAANGKSLEWIPIIIHPKPQNEVEELAIAAEGNGDTDFAYWNKEAVANEEEKFKQVPNYESYSFNFSEQPTFDDVFQRYEPPAEEQEEEKQVKPPQVLHCPACEYEGEKKFFLKK